MKMGRAFLIKEMEDYPEYVEHYESINDPIVTDVNATSDDMDKDSKMSKGTTPTKQF